MLAGSAACGTMENLSAAQKLDRAFDRLGEQRSLTLEFDLDTDAAALKKLDADSAPEDKAPQGLLDLVSDGTISISMESKKPIAESKEKDITGYSVKLTGPDGALMEYRLVGDFLYARIDAEQFGELTDTPLPSVEELSQSGELPPEAEPLKKLLEGKWLKVSAKEINEAGLFQGLSDAGSGSKGSDELALKPETQKKVFKAVRDVIANDVELKTADGEDGTERITATASLRTLATSMVDKLRPLAKELPAGAKLPTAKELKEVPGKKGSADFTLKDGDLTQVDFDLTQLDKKLKGEKFGLTMRLTEGETPVAPAESTKVDLDSLMQGFMPDPGFSEEEL
ncbi:hypothetical protein JNUCC64_31875 [Streptomyces sp. JNUCC 64]